MRYYPAPEEAIDISSLIEAVRAAFIDHGTGSCQMPPKTYVSLPGGDFRTMPSYLPSLNVAGVKVVNVHPGNREQNLPTVMALTVLLDPATGAPTAILNATGLTDLRTGASAAVATAALAPVHEGTVGVIGAGRQARAGLQSISRVFDVQTVKVWSRSSATAEEFVREFSDMEVRIGTLEQVADADVLLTTTPSTRPIIMKEWISDGTHINAIGADAPGKQELDPRLLKAAQIIVDDREQAFHSGEVNVPLSEGVLRPEDIAGTLGEVLTGKITRRSSETITIFDSTGIAITDLAIASLAMNRGKMIDLPFRTDRECAGYNR